MYDYKNLSQDLTGMIKKPGYEKMLAKNSNMKNGLK